MSSKFRWEGDLIQRLDGMDDNVRKGMVAAMEYVAPQAESFMKSEAPWTDRTGAARNGLGTKVVVSPATVALIMYHSVPYGVFLEVRWAGKYAIIQPTMAAAGPLILDALSKLLFKEV